MPKGLLDKLTREEILDLVADQGEDPPARHREGRTDRGQMVALDGAHDLEGILLIAMTGALGVETLLPVFSAGTWHTGPAGYGLLRMAPGIAAVLAEHEGLAAGQYDPGDSRRAHQV